MGELDRAKYISFGTYRRDGTLVSTPTWVVAIREGYAFTTDLDSWKAKRLSRDQRAVVTPCTIRGRALPGATTFQGHGEVLEGAAAEDVARTVRRKYRVMWIMTISSRQLMQKIKRKPVVPDCAIYFVVEQTA
jgi:PPOX class probable F420-dependent enzyme